MIRTLIAILLALPLTSFAPAPAAAPVIYHTQITIVQTNALHTQACTWETAPARLRQEISDPAGIPFGVVTAWSCSGDAQAVTAELSERANTMQAQANEYRAAHPLATPIPSKGREP